ncbi:MAG: hypothetical protein EXR21_07380 [Flavobacteriaceae bacterium]|nr:hypothetical protein [Flavobacteriaceae bacterium]
MKETEIIDNTTVKPKIIFDKLTKRTLLKNLCEERQVTVHCSIEAGASDKIRIWKSTYLYPDNSKRECALVHAINISLYPEWTPIAVGKTAHFTLIFTALPKNCKSFYLLECIPETNMFYAGDIIRNKEDVYWVEIEVLPIIVSPKL